MGTGTSMDCRIAMDDGIELAATLYLPETPSPPQTLTIDGDASTLTLPVAFTAPTPAAATLATMPRARTDPRPGSMTARDRYTGEVTIDRRTWRQRASSSASFTLTWGDVTVSTSSDVTYTADERETGVEITLAAHEGTELVGRRTWRETYPREFG